LIFEVGTSEHPEEPTDRCCLSALAGLSKYLPLLGAAVIIRNFGAMSTSSAVILPIVGVSSLMCKKK
jgi:hypothetical protein